MILDSIAQTHGPDKRIGCHGYTPFYERHLGYLKDQPIKFMEIGIADGASFRMWKEWLPNAFLIGLDINDAPAIEGVLFFKGRQEDESTINRILSITGDLDVLIDDGGHIGAQQIASFNILWKRIKPGGWYIIEDLETGYTGEEEKKQLMPFLFSLVDQVHKDRESEIEAIYFHREIVFIKKKPCTIS